MARYQYAGPGPDESSGELIRPGDVREFDQEPAWGPWELLDVPPEPEEPEPAAPAVTPAPAKPFTAPPATAEGM